VRFAFRGREQLVVDVTPLIDIVFQLLLFFMVTTTFVTTPAIDVNLPDSSSSRLLKDRDDLEVEINVDRGLRLDDAPVDIEALRVIFEERAAVTPGSMVIIHADEEVDHGRVVEIMDLARNSGLQRLGIATEGDPKAGP
jgi:biopolymer transport protein ExbD